MKKDEMNMVLGVAGDMHPKRRSHILSKWWKKGWLKNGKTTTEFNRVKSLIVNKGDLIRTMDGRVVIVHFDDTWGFPPTCGIIEDHNDNGWHFYTASRGNSNRCYFLGHSNLPGISYVELHPNPRKIWERMNYLYWKRDGRSDRFHQKIGTIDPFTTCDYSQANKGIFTYSNPHGKIGECYSWCQCKHLGD